MLKQLVILVTITLALLQSVASAQQMPTEKQIEQFKKLPRAQQEALANQYGIDLDSLNLGASSSVQGTIKQEKKGSSPDLSSISQIDARPMSELSPSELRERLEKEDSELKPFGYELFTSEMTTFAPVNNAPVPSNYLIGAGDWLHIQYYGKESSSIDVQVDREGRIHLEQLGPMNVAGLRYDEVKELIKATVSKKMIGIDAAVSMGELRSMQIFVVGEAQKPGAYTVSSLTTISQALSSAGGISEIASLRNIQLKRRGEVAANFDVYDLLMKGDNSADKLLRDGDVIFIPPRKHSAIVRGEVVRPALYEFRKGETVKDVLSYAGGLLASAHSTSLELLRHSNDGRNVLTVDLSEQGTHLEMQNGDELVARQANTTVNGGVTLIGAAAQPGYYEHRDSLHINDILTNINSSTLPITDLNYGLVIREYEDRTRIKILQFNVANAIRGGEHDNLSLQRNDQILLFSRYESAEAEENQLSSWLKTENEVAREERERVLKLYREQFFRELISTENLTELFEEDEPKRVAGFDQELRDIFDAESSDRSPEYYSKYSRYNLLQPVLYQLRNQYSATGSLALIFIDGEVRYPGIYPLAQNSTAERAINAAGGLKESAYLERADITRTVFSDEEAITKYIPINLRELTAHKKSFELKGRDQLNILKIPSWQSTLKVRLTGEVRFPGTYNIRRGETLTTLIARAGGLTEYAFTEGALFTREDLREAERRQLDNLAQQLRREMASNSITDNGGNIPYSEVEQVLEDMTNIDAVGRLIIDLDKILASTNSTSSGLQSSDIQLKDGDALYIPTVKNTVSIIGEVQLASSYRYESGLGLEDYLERAGGIRKKGDDERIYIIRANGAIEVPKSQWFSVKSAEVRPGDTIVVPLDSEYVNNIELWSSVTQIMYQVGVALAALGNL